MAEGKADGEPPAGSHSPLPFLPLPPSFLSPNQPDLIKQYRKSWNLSPELTPFTLAWIALLMLWTEMALGKEARCIEPVASSSALCVENDLGTYAFSVTSCDQKDR
jgi:hypothetical protein